jgi:hypothetical protein
MCDIWYRSNGYDASNDGCWGATYHPHQLKKRSKLSDSQPLSCYCGSKWSLGLPRIWFSMSVSSAFFPSNIKPFISFQMFHAAHVTISKKLGPWKFLFAVKNMSLIKAPDCHSMLHKSQHLLANGHSMKRWSLVSRWFWLHITQLAPVGRYQCLPIIMSLVFKRSIKRSHANTFIF